MEKKKNIEKKIIDEKLKDENVDISLPPQRKRLLILEFIQLLKQLMRLYQYLVQMGLTYEEGPDIEDDFHNFTALNIPENHPARQMHDTFLFK